MLGYRLILWLVLLCAARAAIVDRIAAVAGNHPIKDSELEKDIRITSFLNGSQPDFSGRSKRDTADRLIDQLLIRNELSTVNFRAVSPADVDIALEKIKKIRFGSDAPYRAALERYQISEAELKAHLLYQLTVLRFIEVRFRTSPPLKGAAVKQTAALEEEINKNFFGWLAKSRSALRVQYRAEVFQ